VFIFATLQCLWMRLVGGWLAVADGPDSKRPRSLPVLPMRLVLPSIPSLGYRGKDRASRGVGTVGKRTGALTSKGLFHQRVPARLTLRAIRRKVLKGLSVASTTRTVSFQGEQRRLRDYLARPETGERPFPGVVVVHEAFGSNDNIRDVSLRFAGAGYVALVDGLWRTQAFFEEHLVRRERTS
jgi:hypothetical protein